jgi:hypothetical protein
MTMTKMSTGGRRSMRRFNRTSVGSVLTSRGAIEGRHHVSSTIVVMNMTVSKAPGNTPPA